MFLQEHKATDLLKVNDTKSPSSTFCTTITPLSLLPVTYRRMCITGISCTLIDNIFVSSLSDFKSAILTFDNTDHFPILLVYKSYSQTKCPSTETK